MSATRLRPIVAVSKSRWAAYAAAGAASAVAGAHSAEAEVHYSGKVQQVFDGQQTFSAAAFPLDGSVVLNLKHLNLGTNAGAILADITGGVGGYYGGWGFAGASNYASKLARGVQVSNHPFTVNCDASSTGTACYDVSIAFASAPGGKFQQPGIGFVGFKFDRGDGRQYGWARIRTTGAPLNRFILLDYAWADPGETLQAGQKRSGATAEAVPTSGSLGLIALGGAGLMAWRKRRPLPHS